MISPRVPPRVLRVIAGSAPFVKDWPSGVPPYIILVSRATLITILEPPRYVFLPCFVDFVPNSKIPHKNRPQFFFVICWCDKILLDLIHGFRV